MNKNQLCTIVSFNKVCDEKVAHEICMQIAAMNPIAIDEAGVPESVKQEEINVAIEKTKAEQVQKAVEAALKKAGINPAHVDSEEHMESNMAKGWITAEDVAKAKEIKETVAAEKAANLPQAMIENIAKGRLGKFLKEVCLLNHVYLVDGKYLFTGDTIWFGADGGYSFISSLAEDNKLAVQSLAELERKLRARGLHPYFITGHTGWTDNFAFAFAHKDKSCSPFKKRNPEDDIKTCLKQNVQA